MEYVAKLIAEADLKRHFNWADNTLWIEEIPDACNADSTKFYLGGQDSIVASEVRPCPIHACLSLIVRRECESTSWRMVRTMETVSPGTQRASTERPFCTGDASWTTFLHGSANAAQPQQKIKSNSLSY